METQQPATATLNDSERFSECWRRLPNKELFFPLLLAWLAFFHFLGNSTLGYFPKPSLFEWMYNAYTSKSPTADDGHGTLIPIVVLVLFWWKRKELLALPLRVWWPGLVLLGVAAVMHVTGYLVQQPRIGIVALFLGIYGLMGLAWGWNFLRASFFPFFLLAFMVPLGSLTDPITFPLRLMVSKIVAVICDVLGIGVVREGTRLFNAMGMADPSRRFEYDIAAPCSGIRSLIAITAIAIIYAFVAFRSNGKRAGLMLSAVPLAVAGNVCRMMAIVLAAEFGGQKWGNYVHEGGPFGVLSLIPYVPAIFGLMFLGRWLEGVQARERQTDGGGATGP